MNKSQAETMFDAYFAGARAIYQYFGVPDNFAVYDYELQRNHASWGVLDHQLHWELPDEEPLDGFYEGTYVGDIKGIHRKEHHTLVFIPSDTGHAGYAYIFDNALEDKDWAEKAREGF